MSDKYTAVSYGRDVPGPLFLSKLDRARLERKRHKRQVETAATFNRWLEEYLGPEQWYREA